MLSAKTAEPILTMRLFGPPQILLDREPIRFESRKAVALLAYLAMHEDPRPRSEVATLLWPESDRKRALGALRYTLSIAHKELGKSWIEADRQSVCLPANPSIWVDAREFTGLMNLFSEPSSLSERRKRQAVVK